MINNNKKYLISKLAEVQKSEWQIELYSLLQSSDLEEIPDNPQLCNILFILNLAQSRLKSTHEQGVTTFGLSELINKLKLLPSNSELKVFKLKNNKYYGDCIIFNEELIGCAFVLRGLATSLQGLWIGGNKID